MFKNCIRHKMKSLLALFALGAFAGCSNTTSGDSAGILIETNTGNKGLARVYVAPELWDLAVGDTVSLSLSERDTVGDTVYVYENDYRKVVDSLAVAAGMFRMDSVPAGNYDTVTVYGLEGVRSYAAELEIVEDESYMVDTNGVKEITVVEMSAWTDLSDLVYMSISDFGIKTGDTLKLYGTENWGMFGDTLVVSHFEYYHWTNLVMDSATVASGLALLAFIPYGYYDSLLVISPDGKTKKHELSFYIEKEKSYYIDSDGATPVSVDITPVREGKAQFYFSVESFEMSEGDTLSMMRPERELKGDTLSETNYLVTRVITAEDISKGIVKVEGVPGGFYNHLVIGRTPDSKGVVGGFGRDSRLWTLSEKPVFISKNGVSEIDSVRIALPEGFEDLSSADESFKDMPFPVLLPSAFENPCLLDAEDNAVKLEVAESDYYGSRVLYWGKASEVKFSDKGAIDFRVLEGCVDSTDGEISMGTYKNHFSDAVMSDSAAAKFKDKDEVLGNALWLDASDKWYYINDFKPFSEDGYYMGLSIWFNIDSMQVGEYAQIVSAKKDSVGFTLQKRGTSGAVNLRIDTKTGVYNAVYGRANSVLDGTWHNYSFKIHGDSVTAFIDGTLIEAKSLDAGDGFSTAYNPGVGYGGLHGGVDELFFFDGTQSRNWMRLFYALQQGVREGF